MPNVFASSLTDLIRSLESHFLGLRSQVFRGAMIVFFNAHKHLQGLVLVLRLLSSSPIHRSRKRQDELNAEIHPDKDALHCLRVPFVPLPRPRPILRADTEYARLTVRIRSAFRLQANRMLLHSPFRVMFCFTPSSKSRRRTAHPRLLVSLRLVTVFFGMVYNLVLSSPISPRPGTTAQELAVMPPPIATYAPAATFVDAEVLLVLGPRGDATTAVAAAAESYIRMVVFVCIM
ncbi:hypothetical protein B0H17DRAFT_1200474 [Mycena rosella]|uniref:Uncharacterized protein n=1 Tax=Mycena rosella TaxID=1033263 RepID=A0AAD7DLJ9_MYCRO|nr:hypothetical protein B0H17DRAFT_1200474 [Mycena rosella]